MPGPDRLLRRDPQERADGVVGVEPVCAVEGVLPVTGRHRQQMVDGQLRHRRVDVVRCVVGQQVDDAVVEAEPTLGDGEPDGGRGERLAERVEQVDAVGGVGRPPPLGGHVAVAHDHQAVHLEAAGREVVEHAVDRGGRNPDVGRAGA